MYSIEYFYIFRRVENDKKKKENQNDVNLEGRK